ncbi:hypothetical protein PISL3812_08045 [Talaromyces islandicus]|uniref:Ketoreductase domain-containing protein n=1 Tax=Talaromyces islandicus TaxID=28573 RepID=A0A0U1M633_TALIS|nr:hypothetical protein PISL3812_08045 [Talaromyces islandicus]
MSSDSTANMPSPKGTVLITGCSDGGMGAALAVAFHEAGFHVIATTRSPDKMAKLAAAGVDLMALDVLSDASIAQAVSKISTVDILVNNAGTAYSMPISDMSFEEGRKVFETNVWAQLNVTKAFLPHLLKSKGIIVNQTSVVSTMAVPFQSAYNASKAAMAIFSDSLRLELEPFGVTVVELKTGAVKTNMIKNQKEKTPISLPVDSIYAPAKEAVETAMRNEKMGNMGTPPDRWATEVVGDLTKKKIPAMIWRGYNAKAGRLGTILPHGMMDSTIKKMTGLDVVEQKVKK